MRRTRSQIRAAEIAALVAEQEAYDKSVNEAVKAAAFARCDAVEQLYELLDVKRERPITREGKNGPYEVASDKDETKRSGRLVQAVAALVSEAESQKPQQSAASAGDALGVMHAQRQVASGQRFASAATAQPTGLRPAG